MPPSSALMWRDGVARWASRVLVLAGVWSLVDVALRQRGWPHWVATAFELLNIPVGPSLFIAALLLIVAGAVRRRLRVAWLLIVLSEAVATVLQSVSAAVLAADWPRVRADYGLDHRAVVLTGASAVVGLLLAGLLWLTRHGFAARLAPGSWRTAGAVLVGGLVVSAAAAFALAEAMAPRVGRKGVHRYAHGVPGRLGHAVRDALGGIPGSHYAALHGQSGPHPSAVVAGLISTAALLAAAVVFLRSARARQFLSAEDELRLRSLLLRYGEPDSLGYFATRRDKSVVFSPDGKAAVTYRTVASVSVASADPVGARESWPAAIAAWRAQAHRYGWLPAVLSASERGARAYVAAGLRARAIGDEAVVAIDRYTLRGRPMRPVRQAVNRLRRAGYQLQIRPHADVPADEWTQLAGLAQRWRGNLTERGFSMALSRLGDPADGRCVLVTAHDRAGAVRGLLSFVPWGAHGLSLDLMRRAREADNGLVEFMISGLIDACPDLGVRRLSLNFAMFRSVFSDAEQIGAGPVVRLSDAVLGAASRFWQLESLYRSNAKYLPAWTARFLCFDPALPLTRAAIAAGMAEGFLPAPRPAVRPAASRSSPELIEIDGGQRTFADAVRAQERALARQPVRVPVPGQQQRARLAKLELLRAAGQQPYPVRVSRDHSLAAVRAEHAGLPPDTATGAQVAVTGRVQALRDLGGVSFAVLAEDGHRLQVMLQAGHTPREQHQLWRDTVDLGDHVSVSGEVVTSRRGELSVLAGSWQMASKCLHPLPAPHAGSVHGGGSGRPRSRQLQLLTDPAARAVLQARARVVGSLRAGLAARGFTEVETPMLHTVHGGAAARPFATHLNAYDVDLSLRIAPELFLKRLCIAGMDRVFEIGRNFRNEGVDATHNPEFTSLEAYQTHADYHDMRELVQALITEAAHAVHGKAVALRRDPAGGEPEPVDLADAWPVVAVHDAVSRACGVAIGPDTTVDQLRQICRGRHVPVQPGATAGELVTALYEQLVEKTTVAPTFYVDFPLDTSPLARRHRDRPGLAERWDLVAFGYEIATAYSELTDALDQRRRLTEQSLKAAAGDPDAMQLDEGFLTALEHGLPPTGGLGLGVDRLVMMLTGTTIRHTIAYPFTRPDH